MRKTLIALVGACVLSAALLAVGSSQMFAQGQQCGGSFTPSVNCIISGLWNFTNTRSTIYPVPFQVQGSEVNGIISKIVDVSNASVLTLGTTNVTILPAPGSGKFYDIVGVTFIFNYTAAYTSVSGNNLRLFYGDRVSGNAASAAVTALGFLDATTDKIIRVAGVPDNTNPPTTNLAVVLRNTAGPNYGGGDVGNTLRVVVNYRVVSTGL